MRSALRQPTTMRGRLLRETLFFWLIDITVPAVILLYLFGVI
jgi:hypothetical protein